jgi:hypothetical protein
LYSEQYFAIGIAVTLVYIVCIAIIVISFSRRSRSHLNTLGELRHRLDSLQQEIAGIQGQVWDYGSTEEETSRRWRVACLAVAGKAVTVLQSCWLEREQDSTSQAIYDELMLSLRSVGVEEITPRLGEMVEENDRRYRISKREGQPPYKVSRILCPGYYFRPTLGKISEHDNKVLLEPALIEVEGVG